MDAEADATDDRGSNAEDVSGLRTDYLTEGSLPGVWRSYGFNALISKQLSEQSSRASPTELRRPHFDAFLSRGISRYEEDQVRRESESSW
jgi:hypothetical protein